MQDQETRMLQQNSTCLKKIVLGQNLLFKKPHRLQRRRHTTHVHSEDQGISAAPTDPREDATEDVTTQPSHDNTGRCAKREREVTCPAPEGDESTRRSLA
ncbi:hypothetical protein GN956_G13368 [Arapaima gigas]